MTDEVPTGHYWRSNTTQRDKPKQIELCRKCGVYRMRSPVPRTERPNGWSEWQFSKDRVTWHGRNDGGPLCVGEVSQVNQINQLFRDFYEAIANEVERAHQEGVAEGQLLEQGRNMAQAELQKELPIESKKE